MDIGKPKRVWEIDPKKSPGEAPLEVPDDWPERAEPPRPRKKEKKAHSR